MGAKKTHSVPMPLPAGRGTVQQFKSPRTAGNGPVSSARAVELAFSPSGWEKERKEEGLPQL